MDRWTLPPRWKKAVDVYKRQARTLLIYEQFANDLSQDTASGKGDTEERKAHIQTPVSYTHLARKSGFTPNLRHLRQKSKRTIG